MSEQKSLWDEINDTPKESKYFSPEKDVKYEVVFSNVELGKKAFKEGEEPKLKAFCTIKTLNGVALGKIWETGSFSVMRELKKHIDKDDKWVGANVEWFMKKKIDGNKTSFIFEELGEATL